MHYRRARNATYAVMALPAMALLLLQAWPLGQAAWSALTDGQGRWTLEHIRAVGADPLFPRAVYYNLLIPIASVALEALIGLGMALWFYGLRRGKAFWRTIAILPFAVPEIVYLLTMKLVFRWHGYLNSLLFSLGGEQAMAGWIEPGQWLTVLVVIFVDAWRVTPIVFLIVLAALEQIPEDFLEAARIDGASRWQVARLILVPLALPALGVALALRSIDAFRIFATPLMLVGTEPLPVMTSLAYYYRMDAHDAAAANVVALALALAAALLAMTLAAFWIIGRKQRKT